MHRLLDICSCFEVVIQFKNGIIEKLILIFIGIVTFVLIHMNLFALVFSKLIVHRANLVPSFKTNFETLIHMYPHSKCLLIWYFEHKNKIAHINLLQGRLALWCRVTSMLTQNISKLYPGISYARMHKQLFYLYNWDRDSSMLISMGCRCRQSYYFFTSDFVIFSSQLWIFVYLD